MWVQHKIGTLWLQNRNNAINYSPMKKSTQMLRNESQEERNVGNGVDESAPLLGGAQT